MVSFFCVVAMDTKGITYNKQHYFKPSFDFLDPQSSLFLVLQSQTCTHKARDCASYLLRP